MANTLKLKRSAVAGKAPSTSDLDLGELGLNTNDGKAFMKKDDGTASIVEIGINPIVESVNTITEDFVIRNGYNAASFGDITVASGVSVTVPTGSSWSVLK